MARVLLVDDDPDLTAIVSHVLEAGGFEVAVAGNGQRGIEMAAELRPDLVIMDLNMPVMDGFEATRRIRSAPETASLPILVLTGKDESQNYDEIYEAGATGYLAKPIDFDRLLERVREMTS